MAHLRAGFQSGCAGPVHKQNNFLFRNRIHLRGNAVRTARFFTVLTGAGLRRVFARGNSRALRRLGANLLKGMEQVAVVAAAWRRL